MIVYLTLFILLGIFILFLLSVFMLNFLDRKKIRENGKETTAEVYRIYRDYDTHFDDKIFIKYEVEGIFYEAKADQKMLSILIGSLNAGDKIKIRYQIDNPCNFIPEK